MELPWTDARDFLAATQRIERERLLTQAIAARAGQAAAKDWNAWVKSVQGMRPGA